METQKKTKIVRRKTNALANGDLANFVVSGAMMSNPAGTVAIDILSPQAVTIEKERAERAARREAAREAKKAAAKRRAEEKAWQRKEAERRAKEAAARRRAEEEAWQRKEEERIRREAQTVREIHTD